MDSLSKRLRMLSSEETIFVPEEDISVEDQDGNTIDQKAANDKFMDDVFASSKKRKKKNKSSNSYVEELNEEIDAELNKINGKNKDDDEYMFDLLAESFDSDGEDAELKNSLLSMGRKYTRDTQTSAESSAMQKLFSTTEKKINNIIDEMASNRKLLKNDLEYLHSTRSRNAKAISDLANSMATFYNTELGAIKELNAMKKTMVELELKLKAANKENEDIKGANGNLISDLFSIRRKDLMGGVGGYSGISGSGNSDENTESTVNTIEDEYNDDDNYVQEHYLDNDTEEEEENDGEKFLKYRNDNVHYVLDVSSGEKEIYAEDGDGNRIEDYPMPSNIEDLTFEVDEREHSATDDLHRTYVYRT